MKKSKLGYQMNWAINLRELSWYDWIGPEILYSLSPKDAEGKITFRESITFAEYDGHSEHQPPSDAHYILVYSWRKGYNDRTMTKKEWKKEWAGYRRYMREGNDLDPAGGRGLHSHE